MKKLYIPIILIIGIVSICFNSCNTYNKDFPYVRIQSTFDLLLPSNNDLYSFTGSVTDSTIGYRGVAVYRIAYEQTPNDFAAYDLTCTSYECNYKNKIKINSFELYTTCKYCNTTYDLLNFGFPVDLSKSKKSSNNRPLRRYATYFDGRYISVKN